MNLDTRTLKRIQVAHRASAFLCPLVIAGVVPKHPQPFQLGQRTLIGRQCHDGLRLIDDLISSRHGVIVFDGSYYQYEDLQSTNGTKINGNPVLRCRLRLMDKIELGATVLLYWEGSEEDADFLAAWRREKEALL